MQLIENEKAMNSLTHSLDQIRLEKRIGEREAGNRRNLNNLNLEITNTNLTRNSVSAFSGVCVLCVYIYGVSLDCEGEIDDALL